MKLHVSRATLTTALGYCAQAQGSGVHPATGKVLLLAEPAEQRLRLYTYDTIVTVDATVPATFSGQGTFAALGVASKQLLAAVGALPDEQVTLESTESRLVLHGSGRRRYSLQSVDAELFPARPEPSSDATRVELLGAEILPLLSRVIRAAAGVHAGRPELEGVKLDVVERRAETVASDGHRMHTATLTVAHDGEVHTFLPRGMVNLITSLGLGDTDSLQLYSEPRAVYARHGDVLLGCSKPETEFPPWREAFSQLPMREACRCAPSALEASVRALLAPRAGERVLVVLSYEPDGAEMLLRLDRCAEADAEDSVGIEVVGDEPFTIAYSPDYLLDCVRSHTELITIHLVDQGPRTNALLAFTSPGCFAWVAPVAQ